MINLFCIRPKGFNIGNDVIHLAMRQFLRGALGDEVNLIELPATSKYESHAKAGFTARTIYEMNQYGHGVIVGGGNLFENGELDIDQSALDCLELPLMLFSLSRGKVYNRRGQLVTRTDTLADAGLRALDAKATIALHRDYATSLYLEQIGCRNTQVGSCPTIFLDKFHLPLPAVDNVRDCALISVRQPTLMSIPLARQAEVASHIRQIADGLKARGYRQVRLLCHDHRDIPFAATFPDLEYVYSGDVWHFLGVLQSCALNVSYRLHSFLPCLSLGTPTVKISYDQRALSLIETVGLDSWNINLMTQQDVVAAVFERVDNLDQLPVLRQFCSNRWSQLFRSIECGFADFAGAVQQYRHEMRPDVLTRPLGVIGKAA